MQWVRNHVLRPRVGLKVWDKWPYKIELRDDMDRMGEAA